MPTPATVNRNVQTSPDSWSLLKPDEVRLAFSLPERQVETSVVLPEAKG
jgi:hypothetical protein